MLVVNAAAQPVPVGGTVGIGSLPAVQISSLPAVQLSGTTSVAVSSLPAVQIGGASVPIPVTVVQTSTPVSRNFDLFAVTGQDGALGSYTVPAGMRLHIKYACLSGNTPLGEKLMTCAISSDNGVVNTPLAFLPITDQGSNGTSEFFQAGETVDVTVDQNLSVFMGFSRSITDGTAQVIVSWSGFLEPMP